MIPARHPLSPFTGPVNGASQLDANSIRGNDNAINAALNALDTRVSRLVFDVTDPRYGATGNGTTSDVTAFRDCIEEAQEYTVYRPSAVGDVGADSYAMPIVWAPVPTTAYYLDDSIEIPAACDIQAASGSFLKMADPSKPVFKSPVTGSGYLTRIKGFHFIGGSQSIVLTRTGTDTSVNVIDDCTFSDCDPTQFAVELHLLGSRTRIMNCRVLDAPRWIDSLDVDYLDIDACWVNGYAHATGHKPANSETYRFKANLNNANRAIIRNTIHVPEQEDGTHAAAGTRWCSLYDYVDLYLNGAQFGGENAGLPVVYSYASAGVSPNVSGVTAIGTELCSGSSARADRGVVVCKTGIPSRVTAIGCYGIIDGHLVNDTQMVDGGGAALSASAYLASITDADHPRISIVDIGNSMPGSTTLSSTTFRPFTNAFTQVPVGPNTLTVPPPVVTATKTANYTATTADRTIPVDSTAGAVTVTLPTTGLTSGQSFTVSHVAGANNVVVQGASGTVWGAATKAWNTAQTAFTFVFDGTNFIPG